MRVRAWATRAKLFALAALAYAVLVDLLGDGTDALVPAVLRWAHRTGTQARERLAPPLSPARCPRRPLDATHPRLQGVP